MDYIGIDPGQKGGIAVIDQYGHHCAWPMPVFHKDVRKEVGGTINWREVSNIFEGCIGSQGITTLEKVWAIKGQGVTSSFSFGGAYHGILAMLQAQEAKYNLVVPVTWKKAVLGDTYAHDKAGAAAFCDYTYPSVDLIAPGCRTIHDGMADALCLAHYGLIQHQN